MTRLNLLLMAAVLLSGMYLVRTAYESRRVFAQVHRAQGEAHRLDVELQRLQAERHAQATNLRVEKVARERLNMHAIQPAITQPVSDPQAPAAASAVGTGASS